MTQIAATPSSNAPTAAAVSPPSPFPGTIKLNAFQILMRRWSHLHPYNAGQVMEITGVPDRERWKHAAASVLGELGLGIPRFNERETAVQFAPTGGGAAEFVVEQSQQDFESFFMDELNRPFAAGDVSIRFCVLPKKTSNGSGPTHYFAAIYDHWIGDSRAMRDLMHRILERYQYPDRTPQNGGLPALTLEAPAFKSLFRHHVGWFTRLAAVRESIKNVWRQRHGFRVNIAEPLDFNSHFLYRELPAGLITKVHRHAKMNKASVNDSFIVVLAQAMGEFTAEERATRRHKTFHFRRNQIGVGTIVDIRDAAKQSLDRVFNLYLSSYTVLLNKPEHRPVEELVKEVAGDTAWMKKTFGTVRAFWALVMARFWTDRLLKWPRYQAQLLHKTVPLVAGISNVNMTGSWADSAAKGPGQPSDVPQILDYLRISPTGPLIPIVFTLTTIQNRLSLCVTYRTTSFSDDAARTIADNFIRRLSAI